MKNMKNNTEWEIVELFRNEGTSRVFIHLRNPLNDLIKSYEIVDLPKDHSTSYSTRAERESASVNPQSEEGMIKSIVAYQKERGL